MTHSVLYWNYREALYRQIAKTKEWPVLDHWGKTSPTENQTKINANVTVIEMDEVPGGLDKIIGNLFKQKLKKRKMNLGILEILPPKMEEP